MHTLLCLLLIASASAIETKPVPVLKVIDGDTIEVQADLGGVPHPVRVRLLYVDTPGIGDNQHGEEMPEGQAATDFLRLVLSDKKAVTLWGPGEKLETDSFGRVLAVVWFDTRIEGIRNNANAMLVQAGQSPYWRKYGECPDVDLRLELEEFEDFAKRHKIGGWETAPEWMQNKANERPAQNENR